MRSKDVITTKLAERDANQNAKAKAAEKVFKACGASVKILVSKRK